MPSIDAKSADRQVPLEREPGGNSSAPAPSPDQLRQFAIACFLESGRSAFKLLSIEAGKEKYRYFKPVWDFIVIGHLGFAAPAAKFASVSELARYAGISRSTTARAVDAFIRWNMVHVVGAGRRPLLLCVNPNIGGWLIGKTIGDDAWLKMLAEWRNFCRSTQLELNFPDFGPADPTLQQLLALVNVESAANNTCPTVGQSDGNRPTVELEKRPTVGQSDGSRPTVGQEKRPTVGQSDQHTNVEVRVRSLLRQTCDAQEAGRVLGIVFAYLREDRRVRMDEEEKNPIWRSLATIGTWPRPLEQAVRDCRDSTTPTEKNNAARLMDAIKAMVGPETWYQFLPKSTAQWTR